MIGYKEDKIFLLSKEEYERYKDKISYIPVYWWLRSPGYFSNNYTAFVNYDSSVYCGGYDVNSINYAVRPALKYESIENTIYCYGITWDRIDDNLYISRMPIVFMRFDTDSNDYETSDVRKFLLSIVDTAADMSDGYHTFSDLYRQRLILSAALAKHNPCAWKSKLHADGEVPFGGGWFIMGWTTPQGDYTYHYELKDWDLFECVELPRGKEWDGHTDKDVERLLSL